MTKLTLLLKMLASFLALFFLFIAFVFFVNRDDKIQSDSVIELQRIANATTTVADRDNAYVYLMGFSASGNAGVMPEGLSRIESLRKFMETPGVPDVPEMPGENQVQDAAQLIERYERLLNKRFPDGTAPPADVGKMLSLRLGMRHERIVVEWCEEALDALSAMSGRGNVLPLDDGKRESNG